MDRATGIDLTEGDNVTIDKTMSGTTAVYEIASEAGGATPADTLVWMPLTTVTGGVPELVWDAGDELIPTLVAM